MLAFAVFVSKLLYFLCFDCALIMLLRTIRLNFIAKFRSNFDSAKFKDLIVVKFVLFYYYSYFYYTDEFALLVIASIVPKVNAGVYLSRQNTKIRQI